MREKTEESASKRSPARSFRVWSDLLLGRAGGPWWWRVAAANALFGWFVLIFAVAGTIWISREARQMTLPKQTRVLSSGAKESKPRPDAFDPSALDAVRASALFAPAIAVAGDRTATQTNASLAELSKTIQLQGILGGDEPRAIILEVSTKQMHYLTAGQFIGQIQIREVRRTSVVLEWNKETLEMGL